MWKWLLRKSNPKLLEGAYFCQRDSLLISGKSQSDLSRCLKGDRREEGEDTRWNGRKTVLSALFLRFNHNSHANFSFTCEHHYKLFINTFLKYSFCHLACKAEKTVHRWIFNHNAKQRLFLSSINLLFLRQDCQDSIYPVSSRGFTSW